MPSSIQRIKNVPNYNPFDIKLLNNWLFDSYPSSDEGGDMIENLLNNFKSKILSDKNITEIFASEIKSKDYNLIINRINKLIDRKFYLDKLFEVKLSENNLNLMKNNGLIKDIEITTGEGFFKRVNKTNDIKEDIIEGYMKIVKEIDLSKFDELAYPFVVVSSGGYHAIGTYFKKITDDKFLFYVINAGDGSQYQNISNDYIKNFGIQCFEVNKEQLDFMYSLILSGDRFLTIESFYNVVLRILFTSEDNFFDINPFENKRLCESLCYKKSINLSLQVMGNCTVVSFVNLIEIMLREDDDITITQNFELSDEFLNLYNKIKIILVYYYASYFVNISNKLLESKKYPLFIKLNENYLLLKDSKYKLPEYDRYNEILMKTLYEFFMDDIEVFTEMKGIDFQKYEKNCNELKKFEKINQNKTFNFDFLKEPLVFDKKKIKELDDKLNNIILNLNNNIDDISNFKQIESYCESMKEYLDIVTNVALNTEDILRYRFRQFETLNIIPKFYKKISNLLESELLDKKYDTKKIINYIYKIGYLFNNFNENFYMTYFKEENSINHNDIVTFINITHENYPIIKYKPTFYDGFLLYLILLTGKIYDYCNDNKIEDYDLSEEYLNGAVSNIFDNFVLNTNDEYEKIKDLIDEIIKHNKYLIFLDKSSIGFSPPNMGRAEGNRGGQKHNLLTNEIVLGSSFKLTHINIEHETNISDNYGFYGQLPLSHFTNLFRDELIGKNFTKIEEYIQYIDDNLKNPNDINWIILKLNLLFYKADFKEMNYLKEINSEVERQKENILVNMNITAIHSINLDNNKNIILIADSIKKINDFLYDRSNKSIFITNKKEDTNEYDRPEENDDSKLMNLEIFTGDGYYDYRKKVNKFRHFLFSYTHFYNLEKGFITTNQNSFKSNLNLNKEIFNKEFYENVINEVSYLIKNNLVNTSIYESLFNIILTILNIFCILEIKLDKENEKLIQNLKIITNEFSPIIKFILKEYHDIEIDYSKKELVEYLNKVLKFNKTLFINTNLDSLLNIIYKKAIEDDEIKNEIFVNDTFSQIIIKSNEDYHYEYRVEIDKTFTFYNNNYLLNQIGSVELVNKVGKYKSVDTNKLIRIHFAEFLLKMRSVLYNTSLFLGTRETTFNYEDIINSNGKIKLFNEKIKKERKGKKEKEFRDITILFDNFGFDYKFVDNYYYEYYQLTNHTNNNYKCEISTKDVYINDTNSMLQLYYKPEYSYLIKANYELEDNTNYKIHVARINEDLIRIELNDDDVNITINDNRVLNLVDIIKDNKVFEIYIKLLKLINMNIDDNHNSKLNKEFNTENISEQINELIPTQIGDKIKFDCKSMKIYFIYDKTKNILTYMEQDEIITNKNFYFLNRYIYNTDCMMIRHKNYKYSIMVMNRFNKSLNFVKINYNGIFTESNLESLIFLIKQLLNNGSYQEANSLFLNINQNKLIFTDYIKKNKLLVSLDNFMDSKTIYLNYFIILLKDFSYLFIQNNSIKIDDYIKSINMALIKFYNYFKFDLISDKKLQIDNYSMVTNKELLIESKTAILFSPIKSIAKCIFIRNIVLNAKYKLVINIDTPVSIINSINSYEHKEINNPKYLNFVQEYKKHSNKKVTIKEKEWNHGPDILNNIVLNYIKKDDFYKEEIDTSIFTESRLLSDEYKEDSTSIIKDYNDFYKEEINRERILIDRPNLKLLLKKTIFEMKNYIIKNNEANKLENSKRFENINHINVIIDFGIKNINRIMLLNKYSTTIDEINSLLLTKKDYYDITKLVNTINMKPIFIDKETNSYLVCFEYLFGNHIRQKQLNFANELYNEILLKNNKEGPNLHQLLMGEGKSSVIAPILTLNLLGNGEIPEDSSIYQVMPVSLVSQSYDIFNKIFYYLDRNLLEIIRTKEELSKIFSKRIVIISDYLLKYAKVTSNNIKEFNMCKNIFIYDEVDEVSDPLKSQLNIISGSPREIDNNEIIFNFIHEFIYDLYFNPKNNVIREKLEKYQFNLEPHLINQNIDININAKLIINEMFLENINAILGKNYLDAYNEIVINNNISHPIDKINLDIINFLFSFYSLLPNILSQLHRRHFGLKFNDMNDISILTNQKTKKNYSLSKINKNFIAIPFVSNETPSDKSEFSDHLFTIALTIICYYEKSVRRIRNIDLQIYLNYLIKLYNLEKFKKLEKNNALILFNKFTRGIEAKNKPNFSDSMTINDFQQKDINILIQNFPIKFYLLNLLLPKVIRINDDYKNISFIDIIKSSFSPHRIGFTGTPFIHKPCEHNSETELKYICKQIHGDGAIVASIIGFTRKAKSMHTINNKNDILDIAINNDYHCIIDVGSYFINEKTDEIAKNILRRLKEKGSEINCVVYINKEHKKLGLLSDGRVITYDSINVPLKNRFYFFDQSHITGIDMKVYSEAKGLITLSSFNRYRDAAQGIFRLRNINNGQTVDFCYNNNFKLNLDNNGLNLINFLIYNEFRYKLSQAPLFYKQNILTLYRTYFEDNDIYKLDGIIDNFSYLRSNIYNQSYKLNSIKDINDCKIDLVKLFKKQIEEVVKQISDKKLVKIILELLVNVNDTTPDDTVENENEELGEEEPEGEELAIEQPVEQPIQQSIIENLTNEKYIIKIKSVEIECFFKYENFKEADVIDLSFSSITRGIITGYIPSISRLPTDNIKIKSADMPSDNLPPIPYYGFDLGIPPRMGRLLFGEEEKKEKKQETILEKREIPIITKKKYETYHINPISDNDNDNSSYYDSDWGYSSYPKVLSRYLFKHILKNIYVPATNIKYKTTIDFDMYGDTYDYLNFEVDSFLEIFNNNPESPNYCKLSHIILLKNSQILKIINETKDSDKLYKFRDKSGFVYFESNKDKIKRYPENYENSTLNLIYILLNSNKINNLELVKLFDELYGKKEDLLSKFKIKESQLSNLFGIFTKKDFYNSMLLIKIINDYNIYLKDKTEIYNETQISLLITKLKENIARCSDDRTIERYNKIFEDADFITNTLPKMLILFRRFISINTDNILKYTHYASHKIENLWELVKLSYSFDKEYDDASC